MSTFEIKIKTWASCVPISLGGLMSECIFVRFILQISHFFSLSHTSGRHCATLNSPPNGPISGWCPLLAAYEISSWKGKKHILVYICAFYLLDISLLFCSPTLVTGQGDNNCGPSWHPDFIKNYFLSNFLKFLQISSIFLANSPFHPIPDGRKEQIMSPCKRHCVTFAYLPIHLIDQCSIGATITPVWLAPSKAKIPEELHKF